MLIYDARQKAENSPFAKSLENYLKGAFDSAADDFREEDHPREKKGTKKGGKFKGI